MQDPKLDLIIKAFKFEKCVKVSIAIYLSMILLVIAFVLVKFDMSLGLQQALIIILGLMTVTTIDAFKKALDSDTAFPLNNPLNQIIVREGALYVGGNYSSGDINTVGERRLTLAEAAAEIQQLLNQLERANPSATDAEIVAYINDETPPSFKSRVASAVKTSGAEVVDTMLENSIYGKIIKATIKGWTEQE